MLWQEFSVPKGVDSRFRRRLSATGLCRRKNEGDVDTADRQLEARASPVAGPKELASALRAIGQLLTVQGIQQITHHSQVTTDGRISEDDKCNLHDVMVKGPAKW